MRVLSEHQLGVICHMAGRGCTADEIAADSRINAESHEIAFLVDRLGLPALPKKGDLRSFIIDLPADIIPVLENASNIRLLLPSELITQVLTIVFGDNIVSAVMDDDE